jgi:hypothetical protein
MTKPYNPLTDYVPPCTEAHLATYMSHFFEERYETEPSRFTSGTAYCGEGGHLRRHEAIESLLARVDEHPNLYRRIESIDETILFERSGKDRTGPLKQRKLSLEYSAPTPHTALSFELQVRLTHGNIDGFWINIRCDSHAQRMKLAEHLANTGELALDLSAIGVSDDLIERAQWKHNEGYFGLEMVRPNVWKIKALILIDRTIVHDNMHTFRRSRVGSPVKFDRNATTQLRGLLASLTQEQEKAAA